MNSWNSIVLRANEDKSGIRSWLWVAALFGGCIQGANAMEQVDRVGQGVIGGQHREFGGNRISPSFYGKVTWCF